MSVLHELIIAENSAALQEELQERLDIVEHKIKFIDKVPVCFLNSEGNPDITLTSFAEVSGAVLTTQPEEAVYVIFKESGKSLDDLMRTVPTLLDDAWPAVKFNRICLIADDYKLSKAEDAVALVEDLAEMTHPGHFIFGYEGDKWIRFNL
jgi:iron complex transport system substrate-binding protein